MLLPPPPIVIPASSFLPSSALGLIDASGFTTGGWTFRSTLIEQSVTTDPITWAQTTVTVPTSIVWSGPGQVADGWVMASMPNSEHVYTQIGWRSTEDENNSQPTIFIESNGTFNPDTFQQYPLVPGDSYTVAVSCDLGTTIWHDWFKYGSQWELLSSPNLGITCGQAVENVAAETFNPELTPLLNPTTFSDTMVAEDGQFLTLGGIA